MKTIIVTVRQMITRLFKVGDVKLVVKHERAVENSIKTVLDILGEVYQRVQKSGMIEVFVFREISSMERVLQCRALESNVYVLSLGMLSYHEVWTGIPTIYTSVEVSERYGEDLWKAVLQHEAGHTILHGSIVYYISPVSELSIENEYIVFMGVKDYEVTRLLKQIGLGEYQEPLVRYNFSTDDRFSFFKTLLQALPLAEDLVWVNDKVRDICERKGIPLSLLEKFKYQLEKAEDTFKRFRIACKWYKQYWRE